MKDPLNKRFVYLPEYYSGCPVCELGSSYNLEYESSLEDLLSTTLTQFPDTAIKFVLDTQSEITYDFEYEKGRHCFTGIIFKINGVRQSRTIDDGSGILKWMDYDDEDS